MYSSANYVLFVNYEDFFEAISDTIYENTDKSMTFFSGYDCDSLAFEKITGFAEKALEFFTNFSSVELELRTKSIVSETFLNRSPISNCVVAYSLSPSNVAAILDNKAPSIDRRINVLQKLAKNGWPVGLRFDPLIYCSGWEKLYSELINKIFKDINIDQVHSVSHGPLRYPKEMYKKITSLYPDDKLFSFPMEAKDGIVSYGKEIEEEMSSFLQSELEKYTTRNKIFRCLV
jgi:spore photoproduct lyase